MCKNIYGHQSDESWLKGRGARKSPHLIEHRAAQRPCIRLSKVIFYKEVMQSYCSRFEEGKYGNRIRIFKHFCYSHRAHLVRF